MTAVDWYEPDRRSELRLWTTSALVVVAVHVGLAVSYLLLRPPQDGGATAPVVDVEFAPSQVSAPVGVATPVQPPLDQAKEETPPTPPAVEPPAPSQSVQVEAVPPAPTPPVQAVTPPPEPPAQVQAMTEPPPPVIDQTTPAVEIPPPPPPPKPVEIERPKQNPDLVHEQRKLEEHKQAEEKKRIEERRQAEEKKRLEEKKQAEARRQAEQRRGAQHNEAQGQTRVATAPNRGAEADGARHALAGWLSAVSAHLQRYKPTGAQGSGTVSVSITLDRSGHVVSRHVVASAGAALDQAALAMVQRAQPMPAFPAGMTGASHQVTVPVHFH
jgi:protein TonB